MAINYSYLERSKDGADFRIIKTHVSNIRNEIIKKPINSTGYYGINGGVFHSPNGYNAPPIEGLAIGWNKGDTTSNSNSSNAYGNKSRGTLFTYHDASQNKTKAGITRATSITDLKNQMGQSLDYRVMIGGGDFALGMTESA